MKVYFGICFTEARARLPLSHIFQQRISKFVSDNMPDELPTPLVSITFRVDSTTTHEKSYTRGPFKYEGGTELEWHIVLSFKALSKSDSWIGCVVVELIHAATRLLSDLGANTSAIDADLVGELVREIESNDSMTHDRFQLDFRGFKHILPKRHRST
jgi:hypothetical protein